MKHKKSMASVLNHIMQVMFWEHACFISHIKINRLSILVILIVQQIGNWNKFN